MKLSAPELETVRRILLDGFNLAKFDAVMLAIDRPREHYALGDDFRDIVFRVAGTANRERWLHQLLQKAARENPAVAEDLAAARAAQPRVAALLDDDPMSAFDAYYFRRRPLIDHEDLRPLLRTLHDETDEGARILIVRGDRHSGKSYTTDFIHHLAARLGFHVRRIELLKHAAGRELTPEIVGRAIVEEMKLGEQMEAVEQDQVAWWTNYYLSWLVRNLRDSDTVWWIVIDDFQHLTVPPAVYEFIRELALKLDDDFDRLRLVLIGFERELPEKLTPLIETYTTSPIEERHLIDYFTRFVRDFVGVVDAASAPNVIAGAVQSVRDAMNARDPRERLLAMMSKAVEEGRRLRKSAAMVRPPRWTEEECAAIRAETARLVGKLPEAPALAPVPPPDFGPEDVAAAVTSTFRIDPARRGEEAIERLRATAMQLANSDEWTLHPDFRMDVLRRLLQDGRLAEALLTHQRTGDPLQHALSFATVGRPQLRDLDVPTLVALVPLLRLFPRLPVRDVERRLELQRILEPFRHLASTFRGRVAEMARLRAYITSERNHPLIVVGVGGIGKSTLISKFILEQADRAEEERFPFAYIDFDRPLADADEPSAILLEVVRQLGYQYAEAEDAAERLREAWQELFGLRLRDEESRRARILSDFSAFLETLRIHDRPLLLVLDTFEEIQFRSAVYVRRLAVLIAQLRENFPRLRTVIASRIQAADVHDAEVLVLGDLDRPAALEFLRAKGIQDEHTALEIIAQVGGHPLSLHLAAALVHQEGTLPRTLGGTHLVQGILYRRILGHIHDDDVRRLAHPGLVLRRITPDVIRYVLTGDPGVDVRQLFEKLRAEVALVEESGPGVVRFRRDVRRMALEHIRADLPEAVVQIHERAVDYYNRRDDDVSRAEEIYHRLALAQSAETVDRSFVGNVLPYLTDAGEDLPPRESAYLSEKLGRELTEEEWDAAEQVVWERAMERRVTQLLGAGMDEVALLTLRQRPERLPKSRLFVLDAKALAASGRREAARKVIEHAIAVYGQDPPNALLVEAYTTAAEVHLLLGNYKTAQHHLARAAADAEALGDDLVRLRVLLRRSRVATDYDGIPSEELRKQLLHDALRLPSEALRRHPAFYRELLLELGDDARLLGQREEEEIETERRRVLTRRGIVRSHIRLDAELRRKVFELLLDIFPTRNDLRTFLSDYLDRSLDSLTTSGPLQESIYNVIATAEAGAWLGELLLALRDIAPGAEALRTLDVVAPSFIVDQASSDDALPAPLIADYVREWRLAFSAMESRLGRLYGGSKLAGSAWLMTPHVAVTSAMALDAAGYRKSTLRFDAHAIGGETRPGQTVKITKRLHVGPHKRAVFVRLAQLVPSGLDRVGTTAQDEVGPCLWAWHAQDGLHIAGVQRARKVGEYAFRISPGLPDITAGAICVDPAMTPLGILVRPATGLVLRLSAIAEHLPP